MVDLSSWASGLEIVCPILGAGPGHRSALSWCTGWFGDSTANLVAFGRWTPDPIADSATPPRRSSLRLYRYVDWRCDAKCPPI